MKDHFKTRGEEGIRGSLLHRSFLGESSGLLLEVDSYDGERVRGDNASDVNGGGTSEEEEALLTPVGVHLDDDGIAHRHDNNNTVVDVRCDNFDGSDNNNNNNNVTAPPSQYTTPKRQNSRSDRLAYKKRQSSEGNDSTVRLYRAHEAGLVVSTRGSARRTLGRLLGMAMMDNGRGGEQAAVEKGRGRNVNGLEELEVDPNEKRGGITPAGAVSAAVHRVGERGAHHSLPFDDGPTDDDDAAPPDERTVRHIESAERSKQKHKQHALAELDILASRTHHSAAGCILSPFASDVLKNMYASKQFSFRRSNTNSSYSRYDSFLNGSISEGGENDSMDERIAEVGSTDGTATADANSFRSGEDDSVPISVDKEGIFRPSPTEQRLRSLLRHAGFSTPKGMLQEAEEDVLSLDNSVGRLLLRGGPSFREAHVFRGESDDEVEQGQPEIVEVKTKVSDLLHWITSCCSAVAHTTF